MINYICIYEDIDSDAELVDKIESFTVEINVTNYQNFKDIAFPKLIVVINQNPKLSVNQNFYYEID